MSVVVTLIEPSGVMSVPVQGGRSSFRQRTHTWGSVIHLDEDPSGLVREMKSGARPVPWASAKQRDLALLQLAFDRPDLDDALRRDLVAHVRATPVLDQDDPWDRDEEAYRDEMLERR